MTVWTYRSQDIIASRPRQSSSQASSVRTTREFRSSGDSPLRSRPTPDRPASAKPVSRPPPERPIPSPVEAEEGMPFLTSQRLRSTCLGRNVDIHAMTSFCPGLGCCVHKMWRTCLPDPNDATRFRSWQRLEKRWRHDCLHLKSKSVGSLLRVSCSPVDFLLLGPLIWPQEQAQTIQARHSPCDQISHGAGGS